MIIKEHYAYTDIPDCKITLDIGFDTYWFSTWFMRLKIERYGIFKHWNFNLGEVEWVLAQNRKPVFAKKWRLQDLVEAVCLHEAVYFLAEPSKVYRPTGYGIQLIFQDYMPQPLWYQLEWE